jgi:hypothetical protein
MPRILMTVFLALFLAFGTNACGGDDDEDNGDGNSPSATTRSRTPAPTTPDETDEPNGNGDEKTPPPPTPEGQTPGGETTAPTPSVDRTPAPGGIRAVAPADLSAFLAQFSDRTISYQDCAYNPSTLLTDCGDLGDYSIDPPPLGQADCSIGIVESTAELIRCTPEDPPQTIYYEILE